MILHCALTHANGDCYTQTFSFLYVYSESECEIFVPHWKESRLDSHFPSEETGRIHISLVIFLYHLAFKLIFPCFVCLYHIGFLFLLFPIV